MLPSPYHVGMVTTAAPNASIVQDKEAVRNTMTERIKHLLDVFVVNGHDTLVLGASGCGVFRNDPLEVANMFRHHLLSDHFRNSFKRIIFAISNPSMCQIFKKVFSSIDANQIQQELDLSLGNTRKQRSRKEKKTYK